jgi:choline dehydrogenase-like flavoprotein
MCDAFPCPRGAKADSHVCGIGPALQDPYVELWTAAYVRRLLTDESGKSVVAVEGERNGESFTVPADTVVVSCGAVNSAALLLRSANSMHPDGLGNRAGHVGRNYMVHNNAVLMAIHPTIINSTVVQKSFAINDFYFRGPGFPYPMGNLQPVGKIQTAMLQTELHRAPARLLTQIAARSTDWWVMSEDLPDPENRVTLGPNGRIRVRWKANNVVAHRKFIDTAKEIFRNAGYPLVVTRTMGIETNSHQVGTIRFGDDPATSVLDPYCKAHDLQNLYVVDASFFPSSTAVNPALTIMAQAIRVAEHIRGGETARREVGQKWS